MRKSVMAILLGTTILAGCSAVEESSTTTEVEQEQVVETPAPTPSSEEETYLNTLGGYVLSLADEFEIFSNLNSQVAQDPYVLYDETWTYDMALNLLLIEELINEVQALDAPESMQEINEHLQYAMDEYEYAITNYPTAVDNFDMALLDSCIIAMNNGNEHIAEVNRLLEEKRGVTSYVD